MESILLALALVLPAGGTICFVSWCRMRQAIDANERVLEFRYKHAQLEARERNYLLSDGK